MSGGTLDYAFIHVEEAIREIESNLKYHNSKECEYKYSKKTEEKVREFVEHLRLVVNALHSVEWMMSGDTGEETIIEPITKVLGKE